MEKTINDPVFGELTYDDVKKAWTKRMPFGIWFGDDYQLDLVVSCRENGWSGVSVNEEITDKQREAYKTYLEHLPGFSREVYKDLFLYYKDHYEEFSRRLKLPDDLKIEVANYKEVLSYYNPLELFIDRRGNYGWLSNFISPLYLISVILSDGKPRIFKGWNVLEKDYAVVDDDVFGEMFFDQAWRKWMKTDINGIEGEWVLVVACAALSSSPITPEQKTNYQRYFQNEKTFLEEYPKALLEYYKENYDVIAEIWSLADLYDEEHIDEEKVKSFIQFQKLFFHRGGERYGWLCECAWDSVYGLAIYYDNNHEGQICIGAIDDLVI